MFEKSRERERARDKHKRNVNALSAFLKADMNVYNSISYNDLNVNNNMLKSF